MGGNKTRMMFLKLNEIEIRNVMGCIHSLGSVAVDYNLEDDTPLGIVREAVGAEQIRLVEGL